MTVEETPKAPAFNVSLENFQGPFEVLLNLIGKHELDVTEVALARVTDEFLAHIRAMRDQWGTKVLDETTEFLVIAATLLDLKAARLIPGGETENDEDVAALEARDLLFARLLQYKAFKQAARFMSLRLEEESVRFPRSVSLEPHFAQLLPELVWKLSLEEFVEFARKALEPKPVHPDHMSLTHLHAPKVSVREQAEIIAGMLRGHRPMAFREIVADADSLGVVVGRFLAILELFREALISFDQAAPLGDLVVRWSAGEKEFDASAVTDEFDEAESVETNNAGTNEGGVPDGE
jgi:segregation and condensation protein A